jgi:hypothetical protein
MHPGCVLIALESVRGEEGNSHIFDMITRVANELIDGICSRSCHQLWDNITQLG